MYILRKFIPGRGKSGFKVVKLYSNYSRVGDQLITTKWKGIVNSAERVVGYPTSFLNLRWLLNDEVSNIAFYITKLLGTSHPIIQLAKSLFQHTDVPKWGLIILLISKAAGIKPKVTDIERDVTSGILHSQRILAEITEMIQTGHSLHNTIMQINYSNSDYVDLNFGNKIALLGGDYLYSKSFQELANLKNNDLNEIISTSLRDLAESEFLAPRDFENKPLPYIPCQSKKNILSKTDIGPYNLDKYMGNAKEEWIIRNLLSGANLLAKSCKGALIVGEHPVALQNQAYIFGRSFALAWQANEEIRPFVDDSTLPFTLVSAPILFHLQTDPHIYELFESSQIDYDTIRKRVKEGLGVEKTRELQMKFVDEALDAISYFSNSDAKESLVNILKAL